MTPAPISVERFDHNWKSDSDGWPISYMEPFRYGEYVRNSDYVALLQQLAEREAEVERILRCVREMSDRFNETAADLRDADRARDEATGLLREVLVWRRTVPPIAETPRKDGGIFGRIAAFLAESGGDRG